MNPKFHHYFMDVARRTAELSNSRRTKVGAVAIRDRRIIACGYNGTGPGEDNNCEDEMTDGSLVTKLSVKHAENNLIEFSRLYNIDLRGCTLYQTTSPCFFCAKAVIKEGIKAVIFDCDYRLDDGKKHLSTNGVEVIKFSELINSLEYTQMAL